MQPTAVLPPATPEVRPSRTRTERDLLVIGIVATGQQRLRAALRLVAADPDLLAATVRIVVVDAGSTPSATVLREAVRLPTGLLHVIRRPHAGRAAVLSSAIVEALDETRAGALLLLDDVTLTDPQALLAAFDAARRSPSTDVIGLRDAAATGQGPGSWWGAVLPLDALRAVGAALPEAGERSLAELALRAESAGFRSTVVEARGPVPAPDPVGGLLLALLHEPVAARTALLVRALLRSRPERAALAALLDGPAPAVARSAGPFLLLRLWWAWPALRLQHRSGALDRASIEAWSERFAEVDPGLPHAERETTARRPAGLPSLPWATAKRGTSAA